MKRLMFAITGLLAALQLAALEVPVLTPEQGADFAAVAVERGKS